MPHWPSLLSLDCASRKTLIITEIPKHKGKRWLNNTTNTRRIGLDRYMWQWLKCKWPYRLPDWSNCLGGIGRCHCWRRFVTGALKFKKPRPFPVSSLLCSCGSWELLVIVPVLHTPLLPCSPPWWTWTLWNCKPQTNAFFYMMPWS